MINTIKQTKEVHSYTITLFHTVISLHFTFCISLPLFLTFSLLTLRVFCRVCLSEVYSQGAREEKLFWEANKEEWGGWHSSRDAHEHAPIWLQVYAHAHTNMLCTHTCWMRGRPITIICSIKLICTPGWNPDQLINESENIWAVYTGYRALIVQQWCLFKMSSYVMRGTIFSPWALSIYIGNRNTTGVLCAHHGINITYTYFLFLDTTKQLLTNTSSRCEAVFLDIHLINVNPEFKLFF